MYTVFMSTQDGLRWIKAGYKDLDIAKFLLANEYYSAAAFHAQQSAEKVLKGLLRLQGQSAWGHNCIVLLQQVESLLNKPAQPSLRDSVRRLTRHYIPSRYPDAFDIGTPEAHYDEPIAQQAVDDAQAILTFVQENKP